MDIIAERLSTRQVIVKYCVEIVCLYVYVRRKAWIWTIHGLCCAKLVSALCAMIHGLPAQSVDRVNRRVQSMDLAKPWIRAGRNCILLLDQ